MKQLLGILFMLLIFAACGGDNTPTASPDALIGTWRAVSAPGEVLTFTTSGTFTHQFNVGATVVSAAGTYTVESNQITLRGNLSASGGTLPEGTPDTIDTVWTFSFNGSMLRLSFGGGGGELYEKQ